MKSETFVPQYLTLRSTTGNKSTCKKKYFVECFNAVNMITRYAIKIGVIFHELEKRICLKRVIKTDLC